MRSMSLAVLALALAGCGPQQPEAAATKPAPRPANDPAVEVTDADAAVLAARQQARANLPLFWKVFDARPSDVDRYAVKVGVPTPRGVEHLWMIPQSRQGEELTGVLTSEPQDLPDTHRGDTLVAKTAGISDWAYRRGGKWYGHFTTRVYLQSDTSEQAARSRASLWPTAVEPGL